MAKTTVRINGEEREFDSKKRMLKVLGYAILSEAEEPMTLRQLYYRFVANDLIKNKESQYNYLGEAIKEARIEGAIPWEWIEDRTRGTDAGDHADIEPKNLFYERLKKLKSTPDDYSRPRWEGQERYVEVWVEKEALAGVFASVASELKVVSFPNRGYTSVTMLKEAAERLDDAESDPIILYFGDFDPSGQDIERNIREKLNETFGVDVEVERVALTREQIDKHQLPPQFAKKSDSRYEDFVREHGDMAVELDALDPSLLRDLIRESVEELFDEEQWAMSVRPKELIEKERLRQKVESVLEQ